MDISKIDEGKFSIIPKPTDLRELGKGVIDLMKFKADEKEINKMTDKQPAISFTKLPPFIGKKVLVAEDNYVNSLLIKKYLTTWKIDTKMVLNGQEAIDTLDDHVFDLIILDTRMPVMDGFETARYIRKTLNLNTPILSLSATVLVEEIAEAIEAGMNDTLSKPFQPDKLHEKIDILLNSQL